MMSRFLCRVRFDSGKIAHEFSVLGRNKTYVFYADR